MMNDTEDGQSTSAGIDDGQLATEAGTQKKIEVVCEYAPWRHSDAFENVVTRAALAALDAVSAAPTSGAICILLADDIRLRDLNRKFRDKDRPTNVLSFPNSSSIGETAPSNAVIGDIAIAFETCMHEAQSTGTPMVDHLTHLTIHGVLHLLGYNHETEVQAKAMEVLEAEVLSNLGIRNPYDLAESGEILPTPTGITTTEP